MTTEPEPASHGGQPLPEDVIMRIRLPVSLNLFAALLKAVSKEVKPLGLNAFARPVANYYEVFTQPKPCTRSSPRHRRKRQPS